jgi:hypothetical protein
MVDINSVRKVTLTSVKCEITDLIKGKIAPILNFVHPITPVVRFNEIQGTDSVQVLENGSIIEFAYSPQWQLGHFFDDIETNQNRLVDSVRNSWIKWGGDYIIFLEYAGFCGDSNSRYISLRPLGLESKTFTMYPIKSDGTVYNPGSDFGLGNMQYSDFISAIRNRINEIKNGRE